jgi:phosphoserine phosphatase
MRDINLIAFDLDGVLVDGKGSWMEVHSALGTEDRAKKHAQAFFEGRITFEDWARLDTKLWEGVPIKKIRGILYGVPLMEGVSETFRELKSSGYRTAIISGGLKMLADRIRDTFGLDYSFGNEFIIRGGKVAGVSGDIDFYGKGKVLESAARSEGITTRQCACVGDHLNDIPMFKIDGYSIAFNPKDEEVVKHADEVVYGKNLKAILPYFRKRECTLTQPI